MEKDINFEIRCITAILRENRKRREKEQQNATLQNTAPIEGDTGGE